MPAPANLVHETTTGTGTGNVTLVAESGKQTFNDAFGTGGTDTFDYFISHQSEAEWEVGTGHLSDATTLVRDTVINSSNSDAAVTFTAGTKDVTNDVPAARIVYADAALTDNAIVRGDADAGVDVQTSGVIVTDTGTLKIPEVAAAEADTAAFGQFWVHNDTPNDPHFTNDAGDDFLIHATRKGSDLASADPLVINKDGSFYDVTGTTGIASFTVAAGRMFALQFDGALTLTHSASIDLPGEANYTTAAGDRMLCFAEATNTVQVLSIARASGTPVVSGSIGQHTIWVPAAAMEPRVTTAPASWGIVEVATSLLPIRTLDYATGADDFAYATIWMPKSWDAGTIVVTAAWSTTGGQTAGLDGVAWAFSAQCFSSNDQLRNAFTAPTVATAQDHSATADDIMVTSETTVTVTNAAAEEFMAIEISRDVSDAGDDLDIDARLHGIWIHYTTDAASDT